MLQIRKYFLRDGIKCLTKIICNQSQLANSNNLPDNVLF